MDHAQPFDSINGRLEDLPKKRVENYYAEFGKSSDRKGTSVTIVAIPASRYRHH
jgi:hypothetical protein